MNMWLVWLILAGVFFIGEMATAGFLIFWLGIGALVAMLLSFFTGNIIIQIFVFVITSAVLIVLTKPLVNKFLNNKTVATNSYSLVGQKAVVIEDIDSINGKGQVKVNGEIWSAKNAEEGIISKDTEVEITEITGVKLVVKPCNKKATMTV